MAAPRKLLLPRSARRRMLAMAATVMQASWAVQRRPNEAVGFDAAIVGVAVPPSSAAPPPSPSPTPTQPEQFGPELALALLAATLVLTAGLFSGLTLALMSMDAVELEVLRRSGTPRQRARAAAVAPVVADEHWLLVTLLAVNAACMEALPLVLDRLVSTPAAAIALSVTAVLLFGEILPQAVCSRYGLAIGAKAAPLVRLTMLLTAPISWPVGRLLDLVLGKDEHGAVFQRTQLKALVGLHAAGGALGDLTGEEVAVICGALDLTSKNARRAMTPLKRVYMLPAEATLTHAQVREVLSSGHSRVPVYAGGDKRAIVGLILVKELLQYRLGATTTATTAADGAAGATSASAAPATTRPPVPVSALRLRSLPHLPASTPMYDLLKLFETGRSHMVVLTETRRSAAQAEAEEERERRRASRRLGAVDEGEEEEDEQDDANNKAHDSSSTGTLAALGSRLLRSFHAGGSSSQKKKKRRSGGGEGDDKDDDEEEVAERRRPLLDGAGGEDASPTKPRDGESRAEWRRRVKAQQSAQKQAELERQQQQHQQQLARQRSLGGGGGVLGSPPVSPSLPPVAEDGRPASSDPIGVPLGGQSMGGRAASLQQQQQGARAGAAATAATPSAAAASAGSVGFFSGLEPTAYPDTPDGGNSPAGSPRAGKGAAGGASPLTAGASSVLAAAADGAGAGAPPHHPHCQHAPAAKAAAASSPPERAAAQLLHLAAHLEGAAAAARHAVDGAADGAAARVSAFAAAAAAAANGGDPAGPSDAAQDASSDDPSDSDSPPFPVGIITIEDVIEELVGAEIVDETDAALDAALGADAAPLDRAQLAAQLPVNLRRALLVAAMARGSSAAARASAGGGGAAAGGGAAGATAAAAAAAAAAVAGERRGWGIPPGGGSGVDGRRRSAGLSSSPPPGGGGRV